MNIIDKNVVIQESLLLLRSDVPFKFQGLYSAHLEMIKLNNIKLIEPCIDRILDSLYQSIESADSQEEIFFFKRQASSILQNIMFHLQANVLLKKKNSRDRGWELLRFSDQQYLYALKELIVFSMAKGSVSKTTAAEKLLATLNTEFDDRENRSYKFFSFIKGLFDFTDYEQEYYHVLDRVFEKLYRHKSLLGKSILLSELIRNNQADLINYHVDSKYRSSTGSFLIGTIVSLVYFGSFIFLYILASIVDIISLHYFDLNSYFNFWYLLIIFIFPVFDAVSYMLDSSRYENKYQ